MLDQLRFYDVFGEEFHNGLEVFLIVHQIDQSVAGSGNGDQLFRGAAGLVYFAAHVTGDVIIVFPVEKQDGKLTGFHSFHRRVFFQVKVAEYFCGQLDKGINQFHRICARFARYLKYRA